MFYIVLEKKDERIVVVMDFHFWLTLILFIGLTIVLIAEILRPEIAIFSVLTILMTTNVITAKEAFSGFSNIGMLTIAILFVVAGAMQNTGAIQKLSPFIFGRTRAGVGRKLTRILPPISLFSAFLNNTPIVAMLIPSVKEWAEKNNYSVSKFLIPISYATIVGGMCTLIGTSTNLIIHGLLIDNGQNGFSFFELAPIGIPIALISIGYLVLIGHRLLPNRKSPEIDLSETTREFVVELKVCKEFLGIGKSLEEAGLRHLKGLYLFQIERDNDIIAPASHVEKIQLNDRLFLTGIPNTIIELQKKPGLQLIKDSHFDLKNYDSDEIKTFEIVVSPTSSLVGRSVRDSDFRKIYDGIILAIHRNGERIKQKIGDVVIKPGDTLLILADRNFRRKWYNSDQFYLISYSHEIPSKPKWQTYLSITLFFGMVFLAAMEIIPLISAMALAAIIFFFTKSISARSALDAINWKVLLIIASSFGIAVALEKSGVAGFFADKMIYLVSPFGTLGYLMGIYIMAVIFGNLIYRNTAVIILFPIVFAISQSLEIVPLPLIITLAIAANSSFSTPISYQTNLMVYGPGGYKFSDYLKIGLPLQILVGLIALPLIYWFYF